VRVVRVVRPHHRVLLRRLLDHIACLDAAIAQVPAEIDERLRAYAPALQLLQRIPGVNAVAAATIVAEIGVDMDRFPSAQHLASWAGLCPGNQQSGGKRLQAGITAGDRWLRGVLGELVWGSSSGRARLGELVWASTPTKENYLVAH
jgi:transposase